MLRIAFLAISQAHQFPHWLPVALRLARKPEVEVTVLSASRAGLAFVRSHDPEGRLKRRLMWGPRLGRDGLFTPPPRALVLLLNHRMIGDFDVVVTTERSSALLKRIPGFTTPLVHMMHGAGDREKGYDPKHRFFDLTLVGGEKNRDGLIARGLRNPGQVKVTGYGKFELVPPPVSMFADGKPIAFYNPHFDEQLSSWSRHGRAIVAEMEGLSGWNFVVAPHVKLSAGAKDVRSTAPNVLIDYGSTRSIDMSYTNAADVYIGDVSSQVYEFIRRPRPCIFLNLDRLDWQGSDNYGHWRLGQVIEGIVELGPALERADQLQPQFEPVQRAALERSIDSSPEPASERQAQAILEFVWNRVS